MMLRIYHVGSKKSFAKVMKIPICIGDFCHLKGSCDEFEYWIG